jgi:hypothetical protein
MARDSGSSAVAKTLGAVSGAMEVPKQLYGMAAGANVDTFADSYDARRSQGLNVYTSSTMTVGESIPGQNMLIKAAELHDGRSLGAHDMGRDLTSVDKWSKLLQFGGEAVLWGVTAAKLPMGPSGVKSPAGATTEVARIKGTGEGAKATTKSLTEQAVDLVELNSNKNRVTLRSPSQQMEVDLVGKSHGGVPTPHTKISPHNPMAPNQPAYNTKSSPVVPSSQQDIRTVRRYLERQE